MIYDLLDDGTTDTTVLYHGKIDERYPCLKSINTVMLHLSDFGGIRLNFVSCSPLNQFVGIVSNLASLHC